MSMPFFSTSSSKKKIFFVFFIEILPFVCEKCEKCFLAHTYKKYEVFVRIYLASHNEKKHTRQMDQKKSYKTFS